ncbi:hypothetical protein ANN_13272 [Periplaneta americana]|uniref:Uncharacterized protein n=1 Tax=Periplaneta americana TaxID=6978 RepID=A0ABQ8TJ27_PERAM|nr:hypothetical protein ANN_13272 [Periplaneta americana]
MTSDFHYRAVVPNSEHCVVIKTLPARPRKVVAGQGISCFQQNASKRLNSANVVLRRTAVKEVLTEDHRIDRVTFCRIHTTIHGKRRYVSITTAHEWFAINSIQEKIQYIHDHFPRISEFFKQLKARNNSVEHSLSPIDEISVTLSSETYGVAKIAFDKLSQTSNRYNTLVVFCRTLQTFKSPHVLVKSEILGDRVPLTQIYESSENYHYHVPIIGQTYENTYHDGWPIRHHANTGEDGDDKD